MRSAYLWFFQLVTGALVAVLLGIHIVLLHLDAILGFFGVDAAEPFAWESMIERSRQGIWVGVYIALLAVVLYHALYGFRGVIMEVTSSVTKMRVVTWFIAIVGIILLVLGIYAPIALFTS